MPSQWPFTGRSEELRRICDVLSDSQAAGVHISGATGVGKSRTIREAAASVARGGCEIRWAAGGAPLRGAAASAAPPPTGPAPTATFLEVIRNSTSDAPHAPCLLAVDDAHLLDATAMSLLGRAATLPRVRLAVITNSDWPIPAALSELLTTTSLVRVPLGALSRAEVSALVGTVLGPTVPLDVTQRIWTLTSGNALGLRTVLLNDVADGRLLRVNGQWRWVDVSIVTEPTLRE